LNTFIISSTSQLRNNRWDKAFSGERPETEDEVHAAVNRKATIVLEHLVGAAKWGFAMNRVLWWRLSPCSPFTLVLFPTLQIQASGN